MNFYTNKKRQGKDKMSNLSIFELKIEISMIEKGMDEFASENEGDITEFPLTDRLEELELDLEEKALGLATWIKNITAEAKAIEEEKKKLYVREKAAKNRAGRLKDYLTMIVPAGVKYKDSISQISWRKSEQVRIDVEVGSLPEKFQKVTIEADKTQLKLAIKSGDEQAAEVAHIEKIQNIQIK